MDVIKIGNNHYVLKANEAIIIQIYFVAVAKPAQHLSHAIQIFSSLQAKATIIF